MSQVLKKFGLVMLIAVSALAITGCGKDKDKDKDKPIIENNGVILNEITKDGLKYANASIVYDNGVSTFVATVTNTSSSEKKLNMIKIRLYDSQHNLVKETDGYVGTTLKKNESKTFTTQITFDLRNVKEVDYEIVK